MTNKYRYQQQNSNQTLQQGLEEYYATSGLTIPDDVKDEEMATMLILHDVTHVVFGCSITGEDEFILDAWSIFGTNVSFFEYFKYLQSEETQQIFKEIGYLKVIWILIKTLPEMIKVYINARKMAKKWGWEGYQEYLDRPLKDIRQEFNISLV